VFEKSILGKVSDLQHASGGRWNKRVLVPLCAILLSISQVDRCNSLLLLLSPKTKTPKCVMGIKHFGRLSNRHSKSPHSFSFYTSSLVRKLLLLLLLTNTMVFSKQEYNKSEALSPTTYNY